jgi:hypothetical protein
MTSSVRRSAVLVLALIASVLAFTLAVRPATSLRGIPGPTLGLAEAPTVAAVWLAVSLAVGVVVACVVGRLINAVVGLFTLGCGVGFLAMRSGTVEDLVFGGAGSSAVAGETLLWALLVLASATIVFRVSGPLPDALPVVRPAIDGPFGRNAWIALLAGVLVLLAVWAIAVTPDKGQALGATVVGGALVGLAGRLIAPRTPPILLFAAPLLFGALGQWIAFSGVSADVPLDVAFVDRSLSRLAYPMPIDFAAGALAGVALGIGWSRSFVKHSPEE